MTSRLVTETQGSCSKMRPSYFGTYYLIKSLKKLKNREGAEKLHVLSGHFCQMQKKMIDVDGFRKK